MSRAPDGGARAAARPRVAGEGRRHAAGPEAPLAERELAGAGREPGA